MMDKGKVREENIDGSILTKTVMVDIQENGIIRRAETGYLIGRLTKDYKYKYLTDETAWKVRIEKLEKELKYYEEK